MARWYSSFSNTTVTALDALYHGRLTMGGTPSTLNAALISTRQALSDAWQAQVDAVNRNGALGVVVPSDGFTRGGGTLSFSNLYTNTAAVWQSNPAVRPSTAITVANSTAVSPVDSGSFSDTLYTNATTAVQNVLTSIANISGGTGGGPYSRLGVNPYRTLASVHHDHALTYFAWDDFTPGAPTSIAINVSNTQVIITGLNNYQFAADALADITVSFSGTIAGTFRSGSTVLSPGEIQAAIAIGATVSNGAAWSLQARANYSYSTPQAATGAEIVLNATGTVNNV